MVEFDANGIVECILTMVSDFCTPFKFADTFNNAREVDGLADLDKDLFKHLLQIVEVFNADAAADEQLAARLSEIDLNESKSIENFTSVACPSAKLALKVTEENFRKNFPNLKVINKDKPHAARRIISRTWKCDPSLNNIVQNVCMNSESIVQQIQYSDVLRQVYARNLRALQYSPLWNQMSDKWFAAKHRFDTWSMPFARVCLTLDAVIQTAQSAHEERRNDRIGKTGEQFLDLLSEETVVLIGMLADAGEENLQLVRKLDSEKTTSGSLAAEMQNFVMKLEVLFMNGAVLKSGYTAHVLELLERPRTLYINELAKTLGGLPRARLASIVCSCLKRFAAWVQLAKDVVATEFPAFELLQTLSVLHFPGRPSKLDDPEISAQKSKQNCKN